MKSVNTSQDGAEEKSRVGWVHQWAPLLLGFVLALLILTGMARERIAYDEAALDEETSVHYAELNGYLINGSTPDTFASCRDGWRIRGSRPLVLLLGNSQLHSINQMNPGDVTTSAILQERLYKQGHSDLITLSLPNASLQEHLVLFESFSSEAPVKVLVLSLVMDDLRETGIRGELAEAMRAKGTRNGLKRSAVGAEIFERFLATQTIEPSEGGPTTLQDRSEQALNTWLEERSTIWQVRGDLRSDLLFKLYYTRNAVFGIRAQDARPMIPSRRLLNMRAYEEMLRSASEAGIDTISYIVPIRDDAPIPYIDVEYEAFKKEAAEVAARYGSRFLNLEGLVPGKYWGSKASTDGSQEVELDFMHFRAEGHGLLADELYQSVAEIVRQ